MRKKVLVGVSGGVDSAVAAYILKQQGFDVVGVTMKLFSYFDQEINDAKKCCEVLGIKHIVVDFSDEFKSKVIDDFAKNYQSGKTPNPCIVCNKYIKFKAMLDYALSENFDFIATGHYCKIQYNSSLKRWLLYKTNSSKDQSYMLYTLNQNVLKHTLMPLCDYTKDQIRQIAQKINLPVSDKPDSQDICFVKDIDYKDFLKNEYEIKSVPGNFVDLQGNVIGVHSGIINYTVGQRKGLGVSFGKPMFVKSLDATDNTVTLCQSDDLFSDRVTVCDLNFIPFEKLTEEREAYVKLRYQAHACKARLIPIEDNKLIVEFQQPQRAPTPGQSAVFYDGDLVLGGGVITL